MRGVTGTCAGPPSSCSGQTWRAGSRAGVWSDLCFQRGCSCQSVEAGLKEPQDLLGGTSLVVQWLRLH